MEKIPFSETFETSGSNVANLVPCQGPARLYRGLMHDIELIVVPQWDQDDDKKIVTHAFVSFGGFPGGQKDQELASVTGKKAQYRKALKVAIRKATSGKGEAVVVHAAD